jgi:3,4-dihydroxy-9,10-secoandrosta-1,3,5(10)-triene-9,17-dione 4,5-dioxygenase
MMRTVSALGYVVISAADLDAWSRYAQDALGMQVAAPGESDGDAGALLLRVDERSWRLGIEPGDDGGLIALGLEVPGKEALERIGAQLADAGFPAKEAPELADRRRVSAILQATDPTGIPLEFFYGAKFEKAPFISGRGARFVTGEQGFGHAVLLSEDSAATYRFYVDLLGFRVSDTISLGPLGLAYFASPNSRHHSIAWAQAPAGHGGLNHIMLEVDDLDRVGRAQDYCMDNGIALQSMLGKHTNDHMLSIYSVSPSGLVVEYGYGGRRIDDRTHLTEHYDEVSYWGHRPSPASQHA